MSRCDCCNVILTPFELTMKSVNTNRYLMMCQKCYSYVSDDIKVMVRDDLEEDDGTVLADYIDIEDYEHSVYYE